MSLVFQRTTEDFVCGHCGVHVSGDGYTNHCPLCLWSKHVDVHPGDRASLCGGFMRPESLIVKGSTRTLVHRCVSCGYVKNNRVQDGDSEDVLIDISAYHVE